MAMQGGARHFHKQPAGRPLASWEPPSGASGWDETGSATQPERDGGDYSLERASMYCCVVMTAVWTGESVPTSQEIFPSFSSLPPPNRRR